MLLNKSQISLLIVDDDVMAVNMLARRLQHEEYHVEVALNGASALERMSIERFDLILLDLMMPEMSGDEVLHTLRGNPAMNDTIVMMLSADSDRENVLKCLEAGADDYLVKPVNFPLLKTRMWQQLKGHSIANRCSPGEQTGLDGARILIVDDNDMNCDVLERRVQRYGCSAESVSSGEQALEKLSGNNYDMVLLDINMPGMNGVEVLSEIRSEERFITLPVIMVSAQEDDQVLADCIRAGANDYISKPFNAIVLRNRMQVCLNAARATEAD